MKKKLIIIISILVLIGAGLFYWFQVRPAMIYSECNWEALEKAKRNSGYSEEAYNPDIYEHFFKKCLRNKGISK